MIHYYNNLPAIFRNHLEDKNITELSVALQSCLKFEEQALRTGLPLNDPTKNPYMTVVLQLMQDMRNRMISFEQRIPYLSVVNTSSLLPPPNQQSVNHTRTLLTRPFCNFCEEHHDPKTCKVLKSTRERVFGKRPDLSINALDWMIDEDVLAVTTRSHNQRNSDFNRNVSRNPPVINSSRNVSNFRNNLNNQ